MSCGTVVIALAVGVSRNAEEPSLHKECRSNLKPCIGIGVKNSPLPPKKPSQQNNTQSPLPTCAPFWYHLNSVFTSTEPVWKALQFSEMQVWGMQKICFFYLISMTTNIYFYVSFLLFNWNVQLLYDRQAIFVIESI